MHCKATMRPVYHRTMWSLTIAYHGRRPQVGPDNLPDSVPAMYRKLKSAMHVPLCLRAIQRRLGISRAVLGIADLLAHQSRSAFCAMQLRPRRHGQMLSPFSVPAFKRRSPVDTVLNSMPAQPNPIGAGARMAPTAHQILLRCTHFSWASTKH